MQESDRSSASAAVLPTTGSGDWAHGSVHTGPVLEQSISEQAPVRLDTELHHSQAGTRLEQSTSISEQAPARFDTELHHHTCDALTDSHHNALKAFGNRRVSVTSSCSHHSRWRRTSSNGSGPRQPFGGARFARLMGRTDVDTLRQKAFARLHAVHQEKSGMCPCRLRLHRWITEGVWFDRITLTLILLNCVFLALQDPTGRDEERNRLVDMSEVFFTLVFTVEMFVRIAGLGLYQQSFAYLKDPWNVFDGVIVITGLVTLIVALASSADGAAIGSLRAFRLLRPLRAVTHMPEVRFIVTSLLQSLPHLADVLLLYFFFVLLAGIIAVQLWKDTLNSSCVPDPAINGTLERIPPNLDEGRVCTASATHSRGHHCPFGYVCIEGDNPHNGKLSFDNLAVALLSLFVAVTMEGWTEQMYFTMDATSRWSAVFFVLLILFGTFFVANLALVMISVAFFQAKEEEQRRMEQDPMDQSLGKLIAQDRDQVDKELATWLRQESSMLELDRAQSMEESISARTLSVSEAALRPPPGARRGTVMDFHLASAVFKQQTQGSKTKPRAKVHTKSGALLRLQRRTKRIVRSRAFDWLITAAIVLNTLVMTLEHHDEPQALTDLLEWANIVFTGIFTVEVLLKLYGFSREEYVSDRFNIFDAFVVVMSLLDIALLQRMTGQQSGVSVFRAFRLMRIFKLAKQFPTLWVTAKTILHSMESVGVLTLLLLLVLFIYALLGMQLFGGKFCGFESPETYVPHADDYCPRLPRANFDHLGWALITVFQVVTAEDWNVVMYNGMRVGDAYFVFFVTLFILGNYVMLNLFIAILIENFSASVSRPRDVAEWTPEDVLKWLNEAKKDTDDGPVSLGYLEDAFDPVHNRNLSEAPDGNFLLRVERTALMYDLGIADHADRGALWDALLTLRRSQEEYEQAQAIGVFANCLARFRALDAALQRADPHAAACSPPSARPKSFDRAFTDSSRIGLSAMGSQGVLPGLCSPMQVGLDTLHQALLGAAELPQAEGAAQAATAAAAALQGPSREAALPVLVRHGWRGSSFAPGVDFADAAGAVQAAASGANETSSSAVTELQPSLCATSVAVAAVSAPVNPRQLSLPEPSPGPVMPQTHRARRVTLTRCSVDLDDRSDYSPQLPPERAPGEGFVSFKQQLMASWTPPSEPYNVALLCLPSTNPVRRHLQCLVLHPWFEMVVILLIMLSTVALAVADPVAAPDEPLPRALNQIDLILTISFTAEAVLKIAAHGFLIAPQSYLRRDPWNRLDFIIVLCSLAGLIFDMLQVGGGQQLEMFRMLRTLRPLRFINRSAGLKLVVVALLSAIPPLANIAVIMVLVFVIFAIMGVQFFKGAFYACTDQEWGDRSYQVADPLLDKAACLGVLGPDGAPRYRWSEDWDSYDHLGKALLSLFQMTTFEGWVLQMELGMDIRGPDEAPEKNKQPWLSIYFVVFITVCCFFITNLFIGVLIEKYSSTKSQMERERGIGLTEDQQVWVRVHEMVLENVRPITAATRRLPAWRLLLQGLILHPYFDRFITACIIVNILAMCTEHRDQDERWVYALDVINWVFIGVFGLEAALKILALGPKGYSHDGWNRFDFSIVSVSLLGVVLQVATQTAPVLSVFRVLRLARLTRVVRTAVGVRKLLRTLWLSLPSLANVAGLLLLLFFMYAIGGMTTFGRVKRGECISDSANFETFANAVLLLFRMSTGEGWQLCMKDCAVRPPLCDEQLGECGDLTSSIFFFVSFMILGMYITLNIFVAIILSDYENVEQEEDVPLTPDDVQRFALSWDRWDKEGSGTLSTAQLPVFISKISPPLGLDPNQDPRLLRLERNVLMRVLGEECREYDGRVLFQEVLVTLVDHNVLRPLWDPENGMDVPDPVTWGERVKRTARRWRRLGYRAPDGADSQTGSVAWALAAVRIQTAWRGRLGRIRAAEQQEAVRGDGTAPARKPQRWFSRRPSREAPPPSPRAAGPPPSPRAASRGSPQSSPRVQPGPRQWSAEQRELGGSTSSDPARAQPPQQPQQPQQQPQEQAPAASSPNPLAPGSARPPQQAAGGSPAGEEPEAGGAVIGLGADGTKPSRGISLRSSPGGQSISIHTSHGGSNITIHNISIQNINVQSSTDAPPSVLDGLPPEVAAEVMQRVAEAQAGLGPGGSGDTPPRHTPPEAHGGSGDTPPRYTPPGEDTPSPAAPGSCPSGE